MSVLHNVTENGLQEIRCKNCKKIIARGFLKDGHIVLKCRLCNTENELRAISPNNAPLEGQKREFVKVFVEMEVSKEQLRAISPNNAPLEGLCGDYSYDS